MTVYECDCGERFEFEMVGRHRYDKWGGIYTVWLNTNFEEWREWLRAHKPHGEITPIDYGGHYGPGFTGRDHRNRL